MSYIEKLKAKYLVVASVTSYKVTVDLPEGVTESAVENEIMESSSYVPLDINADGSRVTFYVFDDPSDKRNYSKDNRKSLDEALGILSEKYPGIKSKVEEKPYKVSSSLQFKTLTKWQDLDKILSRYNLHNTIHIGGSGAIAYTFEDALIRVAYADDAPVAWAAITQALGDREKWLDDTAQVQRFVHPAYRGRNITVKMLTKLVPAYRKKYPQYEKLTGAVPTAIKTLWKSFDDVKEESPKKTIKIDGHTASKVSGTWHGLKIIEPPDYHQHIKDLMGERDILGGYYDVPYTSITNRKPDVDPSTWYFGGYGGHTVRKKDVERAKKLAEAIKKNKAIEPLLLIQDDRHDDWGVFEGQHRFAALWMLGYKSFPAIVVPKTTEKA